MALYPTLCCSMSMNAAVCSSGCSVLQVIIIIQQPAARGEKGGNAIYTLIMPAPLNTCLDRCNILDISSSFFSYSSSPLHSFPSFLIPRTIRSPMPIFALHIMNTEQQRRRAAAVICARQHVYVCKIYKTNVCPCRFHSFLSFPVNRPPSKNIPYPSFHNNP